MSIFKKEFKDGIASFLIWALVLSIFLVVAMFEYESLRGGIDDIVGMFPRTIMIVLGISPGINMSTTIGYYAVLNFYFLITLIFFSISQGNKTINHEVINKTHEFLFTKPVKRNKILKEKLLSAIIYIFSINVVVLIVSFITFLLVDTADSALWLFFITNLLISYLFLAVSCFINTFCSTSNKSSQLIYGIFLIVFVFSVVFDFLGEGWFIQILTPLKYFEASRLIDNKIALFYLVFTILLTLILTYFTFLLYNKKDLKSV